MTAVPKYYFDVRNGAGLYPDHDGFYFETRYQAEIEATRSLADYARDLTGSEVEIAVHTDDGPVFKVALTLQG